MFSKLRNIHTSCHTKQVQIDTSTAHLQALWRVQFRLNYLIQDWMSLKSSQRRIPHVGLASIQQNSKTSKLVNYTNLERYKCSPRQTCSLASLCIQASPLDICIQRNYFNILLTGHCEPFISIVAKLGTNARGKKKKKKRANYCIVVGHLLDL